MIPLPDTQDEIILLLQDSYVHLKRIFLGGLGIHSAGLRLSLVGPPLLNSLSVSASLASRSITYKNYLSVKIKWFRKSYPYLYTGTKLFEVVITNMQEYVYESRLVIYAIKHFVIAKLKKKKKKKTKKKTNFFLHDRH